MADLDYCPEVFGELVTDRGLGAYYNAADINRVGRAANCLAREMTLMGYPVTDELPTEWAMNAVASRWGEGREENRGREATIGGTSSATPPASDTTMKRLSLAR